MWRGKYVINLLLSNFAVYIHAKKTGDFLVFTFIESVSNFIIWTLAAFFFRLFLLFHSFCIWKVNESNQEFLFLLRGQELFQYCRKEPNRVWHRGLFFRLALSNELYLFVTCSYIFLHNFVVISFNCDIILPTEWTIQN